VLLAAEGLNNVQIANTLGVEKFTPRKWRNRFAELGMDGLQGEPWTAVSNDRKRA